jgi:Holliday junction resolvasome RuvABC endonuclease subunit
MKIKVILHLNIKIKKFYRIKIITKIKIIIKNKKFNKIKKELIEVVDQYSPDVAVIEQSVYIQNFQTSRIISYIIGFTWGIISDRCRKIEDVSPLSWKPAIGYKNVTKKDGLDLDKNGAKGSMQIKMKNERKLTYRLSVLSYLDTPIAGST